MQLPSLAGPEVVAEVELPALAGPEVVGVDLDLHQASQAEAEVVVLRCPRGSRHCLGRASVGSVKVLRHHKLVA